MLRQLGRRVRRTAAGATGAGADLSGSGPRCEVVDVDTDDDSDLVCQFERAGTGYTGDEGVTTPCSAGRTSSPPVRSVRGEDRVDVR